MPAARGLPIMKGFTVMNNASLPEKKKRPSKKLITVVSVILAIAAILVVLSFLTPSRAELSDCVSDELKSKRKYSESYTSFGFINVFVGNDEASKVMVSETFLGFAGKIYKADDGFLGVIADFIRWIPVLLEGTGVTISLTIVSVMAGLVFSLFLALGKISKNKVVGKLCDAYIFFFRGTPLLMQLYFVYYALPLINEKLMINNRFLAAFIAFSLNSAAYCAEIIRAAIQSIDKGQFEAAKALGMSYWQTMGRIVIPQSVRRLIPPVANEFIMVLKDASLVSIIALTDLTFLTKKLSVSNATPLVYIPSMLIYLLITAFFTYVFNRLEKKYSIYE